MNRLSLLLSALLEKLQDSISNVSRFVEKAKHYTKIPELTSELLHLFIERIEVGERGERKPAK